MTLRRRWTKVPLTMSMQKNREKVFCSMSCIGVVSSIAANSKASPDSSYRHDNAIIGANFPLRLAC